MENAIEIIKKGDEILAIIIYGRYSSNRTEFFTPNSFPQQIGLISYDAGHIIPAHIHNNVKREIKQTQEVLVIRKGRVKVNLYDGSRNYLESRTLGAGDVLFLAGGGHEFKFIEYTQIIEIKQGPYLGDKKDKTRFKGIEEQ